MALYYIPQYRTTTLNVAGGIDDTVTTGIKLTSIPADLDITLPGLICIDWADPLVTATAEWITYTSIDGTNVLQGAARAAEGYAAKSHDNGAVIAWVVSKSHVNNLNDKLTGRDATAIEDEHGNEVLKSAHVASAVNEVTLTNAATNTNPVVSVTGGDTNVGLDIKMKGTGKFRRPAIVEIMAIDPPTNTSTGDAKSFFRVPEELNGMNLTGVAASVYTAGTTGTTDIQIRNKTDSQDMLSTKLTIDSAETDTSTAATPAVINTSYDDVATGDILAIDVDAVSTTPAKGLLVMMRFEIP